MLPIKTSYEKFKLISMNKYVLGNTISLLSLETHFLFDYVSILHCQQKQDKDQQSRKRDLIYTDVAVTETTGWIAPPAADAQTYVTVQTKPHTD